MGIYSIHTQETLTHGELIHLTAGVSLTHNHTHCLELATYKHVLTKVKKSKDQIDTITESVYSDLSETRTDLQSFISQFWTLFELFQVKAIHTWT